MSSRRPVPAVGEDPLGFITGTLRNLHGPALGYFFILLVCFVWVGGSFLVESLEAAGLSPLLLTYICNALFVVLLPVYFVRKQVSGGEVNYDEANRGGENDDDDADEFNSAYDESHYVSAASETEEDGGYGTRLLDIPEGDVECIRGRIDTRRINSRTSSSMDNQSNGNGENVIHSRSHHRSFVGLTDAERFHHTVRAAVYIAPLWFTAQLLFNYSLLYTSVTSNSILSTSSAVFTFGLSVWLVNERYTNKRLAAILVYMLGSGLVTLADSNSSGEPLDVPMDDTTYSPTSTGDDVVIESGSIAKDSNLGNFLCILAAAMYAGYTAAIRYFLPDDPETSMLLFLGTLGAVNLIGVGCLILLGYSVFGLWSDLFTDCTSSVIALAIAKGLIDNVLSDYLWARAVLLTSPTTASVGLSLQIPLAAVVEVFLGHAKWLGDAGATTFTFLGCGLVISGFVGVVYL